MIPSFFSRSLERSEIAIAPSPRGLGRDNSTISKPDTLGNPQTTQSVPGCGGLRRPKKFSPPQRGAGGKAEKQGNYEGDNLKFPAMIENDSHSTISPSNDIVNLPARAKKFRLAILQRRLTDALDILAAAGYHGEVAIFLLSIQGEV